MNRTEAALLSSLLLTTACDKDTNDVDSGLVIEPCKVTATLEAYPSPLVEHADLNPLTDVRNTVRVTVFNTSSDLACPESELHLANEDAMFTHTVPQLEAGQYTRILEKNVILSEEGETNFVVSMDDEVLSRKNFPVREVGSVLIGQMAEYLADEFNKRTDTPCEEASENGVSLDSPYCEAMQVAAEKGWILSDYSGGQEYSTLNHATLATVLVRAYPEYFDVIGQPCELPEGEWYTANMQLVATAFPEIDLCDPNADTLIHELYGTSYPSGGILDQL